MAETAGNKVHIYYLSSPWENGKCESFNGKRRDECMNAHWFRTLREVRVLIEIWRKQNSSEEHTDHLNTVA